MLPREHRQYIGALFGTLPFEDSDDPPHPYLQQLIDDIDELSDIAPDVIADIDHVPLRLFSDPGLASRFLAIDLGMIKAKVTSYCIPPPGVLMRFAWWATHVQPLQRFRHLCATTIGSGGIISTPDTRREKCSDST